MTYTIVAVVQKIEKVESQYKVRIKGVGKHLYTDSNKKEWILLEEDPIPSSSQGGIGLTKSKLIDVQTQLSVGTTDDVFKNVLAVAMVNKKVLKLTIDESESLSIKEIEVP